MATAVKKVFECTFDFPEPRMYVSDPCYELNAEARKNRVVDIVPGRWRFVETESNGSSIVVAWNEKLETEKVLSVVAKAINAEEKKSYDDDDDEYVYSDALKEYFDEHESCFGVDSGQMGFWIPSMFPTTYDDLEGIPYKEFRKNLKKGSKKAEESDDESETFYEIVCDISDETHKMREGVCFSTGGDGGFGLLVKKNEKGRIYALTMKFI